MFSLNKQRHQSIIANPATMPVCESKLAWLPESNENFGQRGYDTKGFLGDIGI